MIKVYYEKYWNDYHRNDGTKTFSSLTDFEDWMFSQIKGEYKDMLSVPTEEVARRIREVDENGNTFPWSIDLRPAYYSNDPTLWFHMIENDYGIIFSDGHRTNGQKYWNDEVKQWCNHLKERIEKPQFNFV